MAVVIDEQFETDLSAYSTTGTPTIDAAAAYYGSGGLLINPSAASEFIQIAVAASVRTHVVRFLFRNTTRPSADCNIYTVMVGAENMLIQFRTTGVIRARAATAGTAINGPTLTLNTWYLVEARFLTTANPRTIDWRVDGSAQTQATAAIAAADMTYLRMGQNTTTTGVYNFDEWWTGNATGDYPPGAPPAPATDMLDPIGMSGRFGA